MKLYKMQLLEYTLPSLEVVSTREYGEDDHVVHHYIEDPVETRLSGWVILNKIDKQHIQHTGKPCKGCLCPGCNP